ncbi:uncharacterized protein LOC108657932 [Drosophila navojoa]|uniref:uncharacterized protein LOC108657932 n=1 Tax=Drosophila navojoa TaxID=7232 RepID=UPI0011BDD310|nr:uncharacterized protein LOC108657932 [Drosophila navojoa]
MYMASIILIACLAILGLIIAIALFLAGGYLWWRHKRSQLQFIEPNEDEESSNYSLRAAQDILESGNPPSKPQVPVAQAITNPLQNNINRKLNGFLNLRTPLIGWVQIYKNIPDSG